MIAKKTIPAVGYVRMSSDKQEKSPEQQREEILKLADRDGYRVVRWYEDLGISGDATKEKRKGFQRMVADAGSLRDFRAILCWDYSRFGRFDSLEAGRWICPLRDAGVQLVLITEGLIDWTSFTGRVMNALYSEGKNQYLTDLSRNTIRGKIKAIKDGHSCSRAPMGYDRVIVDPQTNQRTRMKRGQKAIKPDGWYTTLDLSDDPAEIETIRWIFEVFTQKRVSLLSIGRELNKRGIKGTRGGSWSTGWIKQILSNPVYCGDLAWNRSKRGKYFGYFKGEIRDIAELRAAGINSGKGAAFLPTEEWIVRENAVPAIVSRDTWNKAQKRLEERKHSQRQSRDGGHPLSGYVFCGHCGRPMYGQTANHLFRGKRYTYHKYFCRSAVRMGDDRCRSFYVHEAELLDFVLRSIRRSVLSPENMQRLKAEIAGHVEQASETDHGEQKRLKKAVVDLDARIKKGTENLLLAEKEEMQAMRELLADWRQQRDRLRDDLEAASAGSGMTAADRQRLLAAAMAEFERLNENLGTDDSGRLREVIDTVVDRIDLWFTTTKGCGKERHQFCRGLLTLKADFFFNTVDTSLNRRCRSRRRTATRGKPTSGSTCRAC